MKTKNNFLLNIIPSLTALSQVSKGDYAMRIQPDPNSTQSTQRITKIKKDKKNNTLTIYTNNQSEERKALIESIENNKNWQVIQEVIEEELNNYSIAIARDERINVLGNSDLQSQFLKMPNGLSTEQKRRLSYFLPYAQQIKDDLKLLENLLFSVLKQPVALILIDKPKEIIAGVKVNHWMLGTSNQIGGIKNNDRPLLQIKIGPLKGTTINDYVQGGTWRRFLETAIYPNFIPETWDWETQLISTVEEQGFKVSSEKHELRIGINSFIV